jgi:predicted nucleic acid-binding protein
LAGSDLWIVDASVATRALVPVALDERALDLIAWAHGQEILLLAPDLWIPESVSTIRQFVYRGALSTEEGDLVLSRLFLLGIRTIPADLPLTRRALAWADRLGHSKAYDGFYLALAEREQTTLWTADGRLADRARQLKVGFVRHLAEFERPPMIPP